MYALISSEMAENVQHLFKHPKYVSYLLHELLCLDQSRLCICFESTIPFHHRPWFYRVWAQWTALYFRMRPHLFGADHRVCKVKQQALSFTKCMLCYRLHFLRQSGVLMCAFCIKLWITLTHLGVLKIALKTIFSACGGVLSHSHASKVKACKQLDRLNTKSNV